ncbi:MAG: AmpG family muropeptide MFS transporter [Deltaproteobacteria bacterium]
MLICVLTGFSSGLPLYILIQLLPGWLKDEGVDIKTIGLFAWATTPYTWKFIWSPLLDRYVPPFLGRRRGWALVTQVLLLGSIAALSPLDPKGSVWTIAYVALAISFFSASQDIVLDAYRRELLPDDELGLGNSYFVNAYRVAGFVPGGLAFILADHLPWSMVHLVVAAFMVVGIVATLLIPEPDVEAPPPRTLTEAIVEPLNEFFTRRGGRWAFETLAFLFLYKLGDNMAVALSTPFYLDLGFSKTVVGTTAKLVGFWAAIVGGFLGGGVMLKIGINRALWLFGCVQIISILGFAALSVVGADQRMLAAAVGFEYLGVGLGTAAFVAFMARTTNKRFTATQFALFSSFIGVPRTLASSLTGYIVEAVGWTTFFLICTALAVPGMLMLFRVAPWNEDRPGALT